MAEARLAHLDAGARDGACQSRNGMVLAHVAWRWNGQVDLCNAVLSKLAHVGGA